MSGEPGRWSTLGAPAPAAQVGQVALPLSGAMDEIEMLRRSVPERKVILALAASAKEYAS